MHVVLQICSIAAYIRPVPLKPILDHPHYIMLQTHYIAIILQTCFIAICCRPITLQYVARSLQRNVLQTYSFAICCRPITLLHCNMLQICSIAICCTCVPLQYVAWFYYLHTFLIFHSPLSLSLHNLLDIHNKYVSSILCCLLLGRRLELPNTTGSSQHPSGIRYSQLIILTILNILTQKKRNRK